MISTAIWECGVCNADFEDAVELDAHRREAHHERVRPEPRAPASAQVKPLHPVPKLTQEERTRDQHPTGVPHRKEIGGGHQVR